MFHELTAMNFFMLFAIFAANFFLVIGRRFAVESVVGIWDANQIGANRTGLLAFTFEYQDGHPTNLKGKLIDGINGYADRMTYT